MNFASEPTAPTHRVCSNSKNFFVANGKLILIPNKIVIIKRHLKTVRSSCQNDNQNCAPPFRRCWLLINQIFMENALCMQLYFEYYLFSAFDMSLLRYFQQSNTPQPVGCVENNINRWQSGHIV